MTARLWKSVTILPVCLVLASCALDSADPDPEASENSGAVTGCTAGNTDTGVCNVGLSSDGLFAVQYRNAWWSLDFASGFWSVANNVSATPIDVTPTQTVTVVNPCDSVCNSCSGMTGSAQTGCQNACTSCRNAAPPSTRTESLKYSVAVNGLTYNLEAYETSMDTRAQSADHTIETRSQVSMEFRINLLDPDDGNPWNVLVLPRRVTSNPAPSGTISVVAGTYGGNAGAPHGNATGPLAKACNDQTSCTYTILADVLGDPAPGVAKDYVAEWTCGSQLLTTSAPPEAGFGSIVNLSCGQQATNEAVTDGAIATGTPGTLVSTGNTSYTSEVELHGAVKTGTTTSPELTARSNASLNRALNTALPESSQFQQHYIPQAIQTIGNISHITPMASSTGIYDMTRFSQFYLDNRRGQSGWSTQGTGEQPQAESGLQTWTWRHRIFDYSVHFPFLAGICGLDAGVRSYISGSLTFGHESCFDGLPTTVDASGNMEFDASAYGALGCNILVASAQAGLESTINAGFEFNTQLQTVPPRLTASVDIYSNLDFHGFFRVRVLFWSKKWEKTIFHARLFQKHAEYSLGPTVSIPAQELCDPNDVLTGSCTDPGSVCDITGRCIRYDFTSSPTDPPTRVDTGACVLAAENNVRLDYEGSCDYLRACSVPSQGQKPPNVKWQCGGVGACSDSELWVAAPKSGMCGRNVRICLTSDPGRCVTAVVKDLSNATRWEGSIGVFDALGLSHSENIASCSGTGRGTVTVTPL